MARKPRIEIEGGLYHVITRGNDRQDIFHCHEDHAKFLSLLTIQKQKAPFFLYAWCLMTNHIHLLIERQKHAVGQVMQRVLTGYSQWYNRKYRHVGHVFQGRHKAILCDSDRYLIELIRYIHLNPVRANMVERPDDYPHSSHREYLGVIPSDVTDIDPVLRRIGHTRELARARYHEFIDAGLGISYPPGIDSPVEAIDHNGDAFIDDAIHHMGEAIGKPNKDRHTAVDLEAIVAAVESVFGIDREDFFGDVKNARAVMAKEILILTAFEAGAKINAIAALVGLDTSTTSRRRDSARLALATDSKLAYAKELVERKYRALLTDLQA